MERMTHLRLGPDRHDGRGRLFDNHWHISVRRITSQPRLHALFFFQPESHVFGMSEPIETAMENDHLLGVRLNHFGKCVLLHTM